MPTGANCGLPATTSKSRSAVQKEAWKRRRVRDSKLDDLNSLLKMFTEVGHGAEAFVCYVADRRVNYRDYPFRLLDSDLEQFYYDTMEALEEGVHKYIKEYDRDRKYALRNPV